MQNSPLQTRISPRIQVLIAKTRNERDYEEAASAMAAKKELSPAEAEEVGRLWRKLVKLYHPDRFAGEPEKLETYHKLSSAINEARDAGDVATLREIANDPDGFLLRRGWVRLDFGEERRVPELHRLWQSLEMEIVRVLEATNRLHESAEWELAGLVEAQPEMLDGVVAKQTDAIKEEIGKLESEAERLAREIGELTGSGAAGLSLLVTLSRLPLALSPHRAIFRPACMSQLIYVETSIPSFYFETRPGAQLQVRREWTREWWDVACWRDALVISPVVIAELEETPDPAKRKEMLDLVGALPRLAYADEIDAIVEVYFAHKLMPLGSGGDAHHLALASFHRCDILLTWNCRHLANGHKTGHIQLINHTLGLHTPQLITPLELLEIEP